MLRMFGAMGDSVPNTEECAPQRRGFSGIAAMIQSVLCSRNHVGIRCGNVFASFAAEQSSADSAGGANNTFITDGTAPTTLFGYTIPTNNATLYTGMCGTFDVAGCCMKASVASLFGIIAEANPEAVSMVASLDSSLSIIKTACQDDSKAYTNIGADACPMATTRNGDIASGSSVGGLAASTVRRRLRLVFNGELSSIPATQQDVIKTYITNKVETALGAGTVESVGLSSGSVVAKVNMVADVSPMEVDGLTADASIISMAPPDGNGGTLTQSATPSTVDEPVTSSAAASVVSGVLATAAAAATVIFVL